MQQFDTQSFDRPIPGMGMTHELGARPWQTPPTYATVEEASEYYIERMSSDEFRASLINVMKMGVPLTVLATTIQMASIMEGLHTLDVGMLVIPIIVEIMMTIGDGAGIKYNTGMEDAGDNSSSIGKIITENLGNNSLISLYMASRNNEGGEETEMMDVEQEEEMPMPQEEEEQPMGLMARRV